MEIRLSPELEAVVKRELASGRHANAEEDVAEAIDLLREREEWFGETLEERREKLEVSWGQAERGGRLISLTEFREEMRAMKADWMSRRQTS